MLRRSSRANAMPANDACASASPRKAKPLVTTNAPTTAQTRPTITLASSARCMKGKANGSSSSRTLAPIGSDIDREVSDRHGQRNQLRAKCRVELRLGEDVGWMTACDDPTIQQDYALEAAGGEGKIPGGHTDG